MRAWEVRNGLMAFDLVPDPQPRRGEDLVHVAFAGVCGSDLAKIGKSPVAGPAWPWRPGHEVVGRRSARSDFVVVDPLVPCNACARCASGDVHLCPALQRIGWDLPGGYAEQLAVPRRNLLDLPATVDPAQAVLVDTLAVAIHGLRCGLSARPPGRLAVVGSGSLAVCSAVVAAARGWSVRVVVRDLAKIAAVKHAVDASFALAEQPTPASFDVVVDAASGHDDSALVSALALVRDGGVIVVQTAYDPGVVLSAALRDVFKRSITLVGSFSYCRRHGAGDFPEALALLQGEPAWARALVDTRVPLGDLARSLDETTKFGVKPIKTVLVP